MKPEEIRGATLHKVIEVTLDEYLDDSNKTPYRNTGYRPDKCGYIGQILDKIKEKEEKCPV